MAVRSYRDKATADIANQIGSKIALKKLPSYLHDLAYRKLVFLDNTVELSDLVNWRSLRLEKLRGADKNSYSIRINDQYRICFRWTGKDAVDVEILDIIRY